MIDALGWIGAILMLLAFALVSWRRLDAGSLAYQGLNIGGGLLILINSLHHGAWPSVFVNAVWVIIAVLAVLRLKRTTARPQQL